MATLRARGATRSKGESMNEKCKHQRQALVDEAKTGEYLAKEKP